MAYYYNKKLAEEIDQSRKDFIKSSPYYRQNDDFVSAIQKKFANRKSDGKHPFHSGSNKTLFENPLYVGSKSYKNFEDYNNRSNKKSDLNKKGGAMLYKKMPLGGGFDSSSSEDEYSSDEEGAGFYDDVVVPVGRTLKKVGKDVILPIGKEILKEVIPIGKEVGKELIKNAIKGAIVGAGHKKKIKDKDFENILKNSKSHSMPNDISKILKSAKIHSKGGKIKPIIGHKRGERVRGEIVKNYMKEHGVSLGEASKKVKQLGLY
jgi:hypothetical protein